MARLPAIVALTVALAPPDGAAGRAQQGVPTLRLTRPEATSAEGFSTLNGVAELAGGRVVAVDGKDGAIRLIDFAARTVTTVGRSGDGPGEYRAPNGAATVTGDTVWVTAVGNRRVLGIVPEGRIVATVEVPATGMSFSAMRAVDRAGRLYWESFNFDPAVRMGEATLTADIMRWQRGAGQAEAVRRIVFRDKDHPVAFNRRDGWAVAPDGRVVLALGADYHLEWIGPDGRVTRGAPVPYERVPVTEREREEWTRLRAAGAGAGQGRMQGPADGRSAGAQPRPRPPADVKFPAEKPPFPEREAVWVSREGEAWVVTSRPVDAAVNVADVFDGAGRRVRRVEFPAGSRLAGFGVKAVYLAREDDDGLLWVDRYRLP